MAITFKNNNFFLRTKNSMYQMQVDEFRVLKHVWYGKNTNQNMDYLFDYPDVGFSGNIYEAENKRTYSLDTLPLEYPCFGIGDFRSSALEVSFENGSFGLDLRYEGYKIRSGKYEIPNMPAVYATENKADSLEVYLKDATGKIEVTLYYGVLEELDVITRSASIKNSSKENIVLNNAMSASLDLPAEPMDWVHFHGRHTMERQPERAPILHGICESSSTRGTSSHQQNPTVILCKTDCSETSGECIGAALMYSGSFQIKVEKDQLDQVRMVMGIHPELFSWNLKQDEIFYTPEAVFTYSENGFEQMSHNFHQLVRYHICRGKYQLSKRPVLINNWEATYFTFDEEKLYNIASEAAKLGIDLFVMDDGWFGKRDDDISGLGDWSVNENKIHDGLSSLVKKVNDLGMEFGIWFEPEMISEDSDLYKKHPEWAIKIPNKNPIRSRYQLVLDFSRKDVRDYIFGLMSEVLESAPITYVKWDMNRSICDWYSAVLDNTAQKEMPHRYVLGLYEFLEQLTQKFPNVLLEGCSGGGGRFDMGMLYYCPQIWCSDNTDAYERTKIQYGTSFFYPLSSVGSHVSAIPNHQTGRKTPMETRGITAMPGSFGYELDINTLTVEEKELIKEQVKTYKSQQQLLQNGKYYRLSNPLEENIAIWSVVSNDGSSVLVQGMIYKTRPNVLRDRIRLRGLEANKNYVMQNSDEVFTGAALMSAGILLPKPWGDYVAVEIFFTEEKE